MYCVKCGARIDDSSRFCDVCGYPVEDVDSAAQSDNGTNSCPKKGLVAVVIVAIVAVVIIAALLVAKPWDSTNANSEELGVSNASSVQQESGAAEGDSKDESPTPKAQAGSVAGGSSSSEGEERESLAFVGVTKASASSTLPTDSVVNVKSYVASNLIDGDHSTVWCEGADGSGIGETVTLSGKKKQGFRGFVIWNGYQESSHLYEINNRVACLAVYADSKLVGEYKIEDRGLKSQRIKFDEVVEAKKLTLEVEDVYHGTKYEDCCISEIECF